MAPAPPELPDGKVVIDISMSLDGYVAGPDDTKGQGLGGNGGEHLRHWLFSGSQPSRLHRCTAFRDDVGELLEVEVACQRQDEDNQDQETKRGPAVVSRTAT